MNDNKRRQKCIVAIICLALLLLACGPSTVGVAPAGRSTPTPTPTPTPVGLILGGNVIPGGGEIELRISDLMKPGSEDCVNHFPFVVNQDTDPLTITGEGVLFCHFESEPGEGGIHHAVMEYTVTVEGAIIPGAGSSGAALLRAVLTFDGSLTQYVSDYPAGAVPLFTVDNPAVIQESGPMPLDFDYVDGATQSITRANPYLQVPGAPDVRWEFILHL